MTKKTKTSKIPKPKFWVVITKPDGAVLRRYSTFKLRTLAFSQANFHEGDKISLKVIYKGEYKDGLINEGDYTDWNEFYRAWQAFTEDDLVKDIVTSY